MAFTNSKLISVTIKSPNHSGRRTHSIDTITIHCMAGPMSAESCGNLFAASSTEASSNYGIGPDGKIGLYVDEANRSWCTSNGENDNRAITIEVASDSYDPYAVTSQAYSATIKLVADICIRNGIKKLRWSTSQSERMNHLNGCNMTVHRDYANKACPGDYLYNRMGDIANKANAIISTGKVSTVGGVATNNKVAWDFLVGTAGFSKESAASCIGFWLAENGYEYGVSYPKVTPPYTLGSKNPYKYLDRELFPGEVEGYYMASFPGNNIVMGNLPQSLINYTNTYLSGYGYEGYCGIGVGSWTFKYGSGALIKYAQEKGKKWDDLHLQLSFAVDAYSGKYAPYGSIGNPSAYAKRGQSHGCTENNFWPGIAWFVAWEWPAYYGDAAACRNHFGDSYERYARNVYKEFKDTEIGDYSGFEYAGGAGIVTDPSAVINPDAIDALIVSLDETVTKIDYKALMDDHVSGAILKAGSYFTADHKVAESYKNRNLKAQIDAVIKAGIRFGLYTDVRSRNVKEAEKECEQLYYVVSKYPPALGLWLHLMFTQSKTVNHKILNYYLTQLQKWGFTSGCGLYCTKEELSKIDWDKYQDNFFLWYVNRFTSASDLGQLSKVITPEFFVLP